MLCESFEGGGEDGVFPLSECFALGGGGVGAAIPESECFAVGVADFDLVVWSDTDFVRGPARGGVVGGNGETEGGAVVL